MDNIDMNSIGKAGYSLFQEQGLIPKDKTKMQLSLKECSDITLKLKEFLKRNVTNLENDKDYNDFRKHIFMTILISSVIAYISDVNINDFISMKKK